MDGGLTIKRNSWDTNNRFFEQTMAALLDVSFHFYGVTRIYIFKKFDGFFLPIPYIKHYTVSTCSYNGRCIVVHHSL